MSPRLPLQQMTLPEKLEAMEALWTDLARVESQVPSPAWHESVLQDRQKVAESPQAEFIDWERAKADLRGRPE